MECNSCLKMARMCSLRKYPHDTDNVTKPLKIYNLPKSTTIKSTKIPCLKIIRIELDTPVEMETVFKLITISELFNQVIVLDSGSLTNFEFDDDASFRDIKTAINSGRIKRIYNATEEFTSDTLLKLYNERRKLLLVKLSNQLYVVTDKNNFNLISSILKNKSQKCTVLKRNCAFPTSLASTTGSKGIPRPGVTLQPVRTHSENDGEEKHSEKPTTKQKILPPTKAEGVTSVPPEPLELSGPNNPFVGFISDVFPIFGEESKYSIQATDGACSMYTKDSFASNVGSRFKPVTSRSPESVPTPVTRLTRRPARHPDMDNYEKRLATFMNSDWEKHPNRPEITLLLEWGFFYTGRQDLVRCYHCGIGLKDWSPQDVVLDEHLRHSSDCTLLKDKLGQEDLNCLKLRILYQTDSGSPPNGYATVARNQSPAGSSGSGLCRPDSVSYLNMLATSRSSASPANLHVPSQPTQPGTNGPNKNTNPKLPYSVRHPEYQSMEARLGSFSNFPCRVKQDPRRLSIAGFFYTGVGDTCRCFCCDGGMQHWEATDDPLHEHAKFFPNCNYIRQIKGDEFIQSVQMENGTAERETTASAQARDSQTESEMTSQMAGLKLNKNQERKPTKQSKSSDVQRSRIVKNVIDSGFEEKKVQLAVNSLMLKGMTNFIEDDIVNAIFDNEEGGEQLGSNASATDPDEVLQENQRLKSFIKCLKCHTEEANILFLPCAHHKVCQSCADGMEWCPVCTKRITQKVKTYMS